MKSYSLFQQYIWLVNTIHRARKITFEDINKKWGETEMSGGLPMWRSTFNRHKDAIEDMFGIIQNKTFIALWQEYLQTR